LIAVAIAGESSPATETDSPSLMEAGLTEIERELMASSLASSAASIERLIDAERVRPPPSPIMVSG